MWIGPRLSAMEQMCIKSYLYHGHPFVLYVYQDTKDIPFGTTVLDGNAVLSESKIFIYEGDGFGRKSYAGFADMFRYRLLLEKGGWWVDTDSICMKPFDFNTEHVFSSEKPFVGMPLLSNVNCGNLKAPVGSPIYEWLCSQSKRVDPKMKWGAIGPALMQKAVAAIQPSTLCATPTSFLSRTI